MNAISTWFHEHLVKLLLPNDTEMLQKLSGKIGCIAEEFYFNLFDVSVVCNPHHTFYIVNENRGDLRTVDAVKRNAKFIRAFSFLILMTPSTSALWPYYSNSNPIRTGGILITWDEVAELAKLFYHGTKRALHLITMSEHASEETLRQASRVIERSGRFLVGADELALDFDDDASAFSACLKELMVKHCRDGTLRKLFIERNFRWTSVLYDAFAAFIFGPISEILVNRSMGNPSISNEFIADLLAVWAQLEGADIPTRKRFFGWKFPKRVFENFAFRRLEDRRIVETKWVMQQRRLLTDSETTVLNDGERFYIVNHPKSPQRCAVAHFTISMYQVPRFEPMPLSDQFEALCDSRKPPYIHSCFSLYWL